MFKLDSISEKLIIKGNHANFSIELVLSLEKLQSRNNSDILKSVEECFKNMIRRKIKKILEFPKDRCVLISSVPSLIIC